VQPNTLDRAGRASKFAGVVHTEQTEAFQQALEALIERHCDEFDLTFAQIVGVLQMQVVFLSLESREPQEPNG
jgi:hypothetical protein